MKCPNCRHANVDDSRFCALCGMALAEVALSPVPATSAATKKPSGCSKAALVVLGVMFAVFLLFGAGVVGIYGVLRLAATRVRALAAEQQNRDLSARPSSTDATLERRTGNAIGAILGTDTKGKSDIGNAVTDLGRSRNPQQGRNALGGLLSALSGSLGGAHRHDPVDFRVLETLLPASLPGMQRGTPEGTANQVMGIKATSTSVDFDGPGDAKVKVSINDAAALSGLAGFAEMARAQESEQGDSYERNEMIDGRSVHEEWDSSSRHGELSLLVARRYGVDVVGANVEMNVLKEALAEIGLRQLESMEGANPVMP